MSLLPKNPAAVLVDAYSWIFRSYYALPDFRNRAGQPTAVVHGFLSALPRLAEFATGWSGTGVPAELAIFYDRGGPQERLAVYAEYKANRPETPADLKTQVPLIVEAVEAMGIPQVAVDGVEADDAIASAAARLSKSGRAVLIASNDKDFFQILSDRVSMLRSMAKMDDLAVFDTEKLKAKFGLAPASMTDFYALMGDAVDNIPGVTGVGEKTAAKLLAKYPTLDEVYANLEHVQPKTAKLLTKGRSDAYLSRDLVRLRTDLDVPAATAPFDPARFDRPRLEKLLTDLDLDRLKTRFLAPVAY